MSEAFHKICLSPMRNENWIVRKFLAAVGTWADHTIVADQGSTDGTLQALRESAKVSVVVNDSPVFDERHRQSLLINEARKMPDRRILIALDADEALSANAAASADWKKIEQAKPGTILRFRWVNVLPGFEKAWIPEEPVAFGYLDDGTAHTVVNRIHNPRLPQPEGAPVLDLEEIVVLHFQYAVWERMASKQRWYQVWEYLNGREKGALDIFRQYNHMFGSWKPSEIHPVRREWFEGYERVGVDFRTLECEHLTWWDREILSHFRKHGAAHFRRLAIWDKDWSRIASEGGCDPQVVSDPRRAEEKVTHWLLRVTQNCRERWSVRAFERLLRLAGW